MCCQRLPSKSPGFLRRYASEEDSLMRSLVEGLSYSIVMEFGSFSSNRYRLVNIIWKNPISIEVDEEDPLLFLQSVYRCSYSIMVICDLCWSLFSLSVRFWTVQIIAKVQDLFRCSCEQGQSSHKRCWCINMCVLMMRQIPDVEVVNSFTILKVNSSRELDLHVGLRIPHVLGWR